MTPTSAAPVRPATMPIPALTVVIDMKLARELPVASLRPHPAATDFPGAVTGEPGAFTRAALASYAGRTNRLGGANERPVWRSLGLYAPPGAQVTVRVPTALATDGRCDVMVGAHWDDNTATDAWTRVPVITRFFPVRAESTVVGNAFGGLIYLRVPAGVAVGPVDVTVTGAVEAPRFVRGVTTADAWRAQLARAGAPWAELETGRLILTVPTSDARAVTDPEALMSFWDNVMDADADLAAIDRARPRAERIVFDRQIVAGYMHAGYPIEAFTPQAREALDLAALRRSGNWGFFHEIGHNHQFADWSWSGTGEATVNLWSVFVMERVVGLSPRTGHPAVTPTERALRVQTYVRDGRNFARDWSVWVGLETFLQLQEGFGWAPLIDLNREYLALAESARPANESERIQRWIVRSSLRVDRDLVPFYAAWGFPITQATRDATAALPAWAENPMR
ncbi:MAG: M60 family metallopeptidase [Polyangiales bacterium]